MKHDRSLTFSHTRASHAGVFARASETGVFVDADTVPARHLDQIVHQAGHAPRLLRAYGSGTAAQGWDRDLRVQMMRSEAGATAPDIALTDDAMIAAQRLDLKRMLLCSSNDDFRGLALTLRALGMTVIGMGAADAPLAFQSACSDWIVLDADDAG